jgi:gas vesicle structural protein
VGSEHAGGYLARPKPSGLADVVEIVLDKGLVIDAYLRVSVLGVELLTIDARVAVASVDTYLRFAEATNRLDLAERGGVGLPELLSKGAEEGVAEVASSVAEKKVDNAFDTVGETLGQPAEKVARSAARKAIGFVEQVIVPVVATVEDAGQ